MLTARQEKFIEEFLQTGNATQAYQAAFGCKSDSARASASALLRNASVQARLAELQSKLSNKKICAAVEIQERLSAIARREQYETVFLPNGEQVQKQTSIRDSVRALELLAKINRLLVSKAEVDISGVMPVIIKDDM